MEETPDALKVTVAARLLAPIFAGAVNLTEALPLPVVSLNCNQVAAGLFILHSVLLVMVIVVVSPSAPNETLVEETAKVGVTVALLLQEVYNNTASKNPQHANGALIFIFPGFIDAQ